jgi:hypothetical protein
MVFEKFTKSAILVGFKSVLMPIRLPSIDASVIRYLVWNNTCENGIFKYFFENCDCRMKCNALY